MHILHILSQADCSPAGIGNPACIGDHACMIPKLKPIRTPPRRHFLKEWREEKGYTQTQLADRISALAEKAGLKHDRISKWENHSVGIKEKLIYIIAEALEIETDWLFRHPDDVLRDQAILQLVGDRSPEAIRAILDIAERIKRLPSA